MATLIQVNTFTISNTVVTLNKQRIAVNPQLLLRCLERSGFFNGKQTPFFELFSLNGSVCLTDLDGIKRLGIDMGGKLPFEFAAVAQ